MFRHVVFLSIVLFIGFNTSAHNYYSLHFSQYNISDGLPDSTITALTQDSHGMLWVGTPEGLVRYDGRRFLNLRNQLRLNPSSPYVYGLALGQKQRLWVVFADGIYVLSPNAQTFEIFHSFKDDYANERHVTQLRNGELAVYFDDQLLLIDTRLSQPIYQRFRFSHPVDAINILGDNYLVGHNYDLVRYQKTPSGEFTSSQSINIESSIQDIMVSDENIFVSSGKRGILVYNQEFELTQHYTNESHAIGSNHIKKTVIDENGDIWAISYANGIWYQGPKQAYRAYYEYNDPHSIGANRITSVLQTTNGDMWFGTERGGLNHYRSNTQYIYHLKHEISDNSPLSGNNVTAIAADKYLRGWMAANSDGLSIYNPVKRESQLIYSGLAGVRVSDIYIDEDHAWVLDDFGITQISVEGLHVIRTFTPENSDLAASGLVKWVELSPNQVFLLHRKQGISLFDKESQSFQHFDRDNSNLPTNYFSYGLVHQGYAWFASNRGLHAFNPKTGDFDNFLFETDLKINLINHMIANDDEIVLSTNLGLYIFNPLSKTFSNEGVPQQVQQINLQATMVNDNGDIWSTTKQGMLKYRLDSEMIDWFIEEDGLQGNEFNPGVAYLNSRGHFVFSGLNGISVFQPNEFNKTIPKLLLSAAEVFYADGSSEFFIHPPQNAFNDSSDRAISAIELFFGDSNFTTHANDRLAIKDGTSEFVNDDFRFSLSPSYGENRLLISLHGEIDNNFANDVIVDVFQPSPWHQQSDIQLGIIFILLFIPISVFYVRLRQTRKIIETKDKTLTLRNEQLAKEHFIQKNKREQLEQNASEKNQMFANIASEFNVPLSLLLDPVDELLQSELQTHSQERLLAIKRNAYKLKSLNQKIFELSQATFISSKSDENNVTDLALCLRTVLENTQQFAKERKIDIRFSPIEPFQVNASLTEMQTLLSNLILNALQYNHQNGFLDIHIEANVELLKITIKNSSIPLQDKELNHLFTRFYRGPEAGIGNPDGVGLGLSIVKNIVDRLNGDITLKSSKDGMFTAKLSLPNVYEQHIIPIHDNKDELPKALCIDDNEEILKYLKIALQPSFDLTTLNSPEHAIEIARDMLPDIIISDIMMPYIDGITLMGMIKEDVLLSHVPVILISARTSQSDILEGLRNDAADYICKPFDNEELRLKALNLINIQKKTRTKTVEQISTNVQQPADEPVSLSDFMSTVLKICEERFDDSEFELNDLRDALGLSDRQLLRKFRAETNNSPRDFLFNFRVMKGAEMLKSGENVTNTAYATGFGSPSHFTTRFKKYYNMTPRQFTQQWSAPSDDDTSESE